jgi:hypothetical protein
MMLLLQVAGDKTYGIMEASTHISKEIMGEQEM